MIELGLEVTERGTWSVLAVSGEVDVATAPRLREKLQDLVNQGTHQVVVDLAHVDFLDSTGLGVLIGALKRARVAGGDLVIACAEPRLLKVFDITGLTKVFSLHPNVDEAVGS